MKTPKELSLLIAANVRKRRKGQKLSMQDLSDKSGVSYGSIKRFESIGEISLTSLLKIAVVLDCADGFEQLFAETEIRSIQEIIDGKVYGIGSVHWRAKGRNIGAVQGASCGI